MVKYLGEYTLEYKDKTKDVVKNLQKIAIFAFEAKFKVQ